MRAGFITILIVFFATVAYVVWHLWRITPGGWAPKLVAATLFLLWMVAAFASMGLRSKASIPMITALYEIGHPWMIAYLYLLIAFIVADLGVLLRLIPKGWLNGNGVSLACILGCIALVLIAGGIHYKHKYREELTVKTVKPLERPMTIVLASDLHLGYSNRRPELARWADMINAEDPDLVLFGGDLVDIQLRPLIEGNYAEEFARIKAPLFTVLGNHEYIGNERDSEKFFADAGITLLRDSVAYFQLLDHQPYHLEDAELAGIDFQFSGHTHRGQVWPLSWVTDAMYEKSWGHHRRGSTRYYVSSGLGIWGPKIRIGTRSEYLVLHIETE